jgi:hypothetical protein
MLPIFATGMSGQTGDTARVSGSVNARFVNGLAKQGGGISAGNVFVRVDSISSDAIRISVFGPSGKDPKTALLPCDGVLRTYRLGRIEVSVGAKNDSGKDVLLSVSF